MTEKNKQDEYELLLRGALLDIKKLDLQVKTYSEPIAIIGMACRFPAGANNPNAYWDKLYRGVDAISEIPPSRWNAEDYYDPDQEAPGKMITKLGGFLNLDVSQFDANFFGISPKEAEYMDPQQRILLEVSYEAILSAGIAPETLKGSATGVFVGLCSHDYKDLLVASDDKTLINAYMATGNAASTATGRISFFLGLRGPNFAVDTACSSSLVAIDEACQNLQMGNANLALAGGVNLILSPDLSINFSKAGMLAADGHCKTFDARADGYVRGEGCGIIVLKRLSDAKRDGNIILAVIKASGVNQDGASGGLTVPNGDAQEALIRKVINRAKLKGADIDYIEAHGTGTSLGDPIEVRAIGATYGERDAGHPLKLGSVKTNIGHLEGAAGIASVIKVILALQHELLPKHLHFTKLNPHIELNFPAEIVTQNQEWRRGERIRRAAVSSFGFSGTNAHIILEEGPKLSEQELLKLKEHEPKSDLFNRKKYWAESIGVKKSPLFRSKQLHPLLGIRIDSADDKNIVFEQILSFEELPYLADHVVFDSVILPGSGFVEVLQAALFHLENAPCQLKDVRIERPLFFRENTQYLLQVIASFNQKTWVFSVYSKIYDGTERPWISHASASGEALENKDESPMLSPKRLENIAEIIKQKTPDVDYYDAFWKLGYHYGKDFRGLKGITEEGGEYWGYVEAPDSLSLDKCLFHPALLDIAFHTLIANSLHLFKDNLFLPIGFDKVIFYKPFSRKVWVKIIPQVSSSDEINITDCVFFDELGECCAVINGFSLKKATPEALKKILQEEKDEANWLYHIVWEPKNLPEGSKISIDEPLLILTTFENNEILSQKFKNDFSSEIINVDVQQSLSKEVLEAIKIKKYSGLVFLIQAADDLMLSAPNLNKNGILFLLSLAHALKMHPETRVFIANIHNSLTGLLLNSFCRCWRLEEPERPIKYIQFDENELRVVVENIAYEILSDNSDNEIRYEKNKRFTSRLQHLSNPPFESEMVFTPDANYIITGGLGGLGLTLAKWCVQHGARNLILCGRRKPDSDAQANIQQLIDLGANINVQSIDLSNREQVNQLVYSANQSVQALKGIFHLAGVVEQGLIDSQTPEMLENVFAPKALGAWYLHEATRDLKLDYFILFSSISSGLGAPGGSNYAVANAFLDALALHRCSQGLVANSVQWGPWAEVGMMKQLSDAQQIPGLIKMSPLKALNAFQELLLAKTEGISLIANINWAEIPRRMSTQPLWESFIPKRKSETGSLMRRLLSIDPDEHLNYVKIFLRNTLKDIFKLQEISPEMDGRGFFDLGMDSLMAADFYKQLSEAVGKEHKLTYTLAYDHPNINALADYLMTALALKEKPKLRVSARIQDGELDQVAVIGMACRFPGGANSPEEYWEVLKKEKSINKIIPAERWDADLYYDPDREKEGKMYAKSAHFLNFPIDRFDSEFFNISPREAEFMDPQQRLLMQISWELFENAGIDPQKLRGSQTGVFIGLMTQDYHSLLEREGGLGAINKFTGVGTDYLGGPGRLSFYYGFRGPSAPVLTACSSSLVATHLGVLSLQRGESDLVLTGGVNLILDPFYMIALCKMGLLSPDGLSKTFDKTANGYGRGEGCGLVLLKRLKDAERDNDNILAVIRGTSMNHNGPSSGLTVPSSQAQQELYLSALSAAKISPEKIGFVESHGTGTALGDPIEVGSIKEIYGNPGRKNPLWIGAVKSNIGHLEGAAGISSLIKAILCLQHKAIPPQNHFHNLNPGIDLASIPAKLPTELVKWEGINGQFVAAVSSFGATGVNAHAIIELPPKKLGNEVPGLKFPLHILTFSAHTQEALDELLEQYPHYLAETAESLENIAYSVNLGRSQFKYRIAILAKDRAELSEKLKRKDWIKSLEAISSEMYLDFEFTDKENFTLLEEQRTQHKIIIGQECEWSLLLSKIAEYFVQGADINWQNFYSQSRFTKILLPHYPFQLQRYWAPVLEETRSEGKKENIESLLSHDKDLISIKTVATLVRKSPKDNQLELVRNYLAIVLNKVSGFSLGGLQASTQLENLGFDSLMLGELSSRLQDDLSISLDITEIQNKKDIQELSALIVTHLAEGKLDTSKEIYDTRASRVLQIAKNKKYQLFLIPPLGFGGASYLNWVGKLSDDIEIIYLGYQFNGSWEDMILTTLEVMKPLIDRPFIIYGHSLGGILAYEIALQLESQTNFRPEALMISSVPPPTQFARLKFTFPFNQILHEKKLDNIELLTKAHFLPPEGSLKKIISPEEINADATAIINYSDKLSSPLTIPLIAIQANNDVLVRDPNLIASWNEYTKNYFSYFEIEGTHLFFTNPPESIFDSIRKIFEKSGQAENLKPGVYRLKRYIQGSNRNISYPLGLQPEGFILYDDSTQAMAAHLWSPHSRELLKSLGENDEVKMIEFMLSHIAYCGRFTSHSGVVNHQVEHASFPNYSDDILSLNYHSDLKNLTLSTFPKTQKKKIPEQFQTLYWESIIQGIENSPLVGCWELEDYQENDQPVLGENPVGKMLITNSNYFSMHMAAKDRKAFHDNNPALATNDELISAYRTYRSLFGEYQMPSDDRLIKCKILSPVPFNDAFSIHFLLENNELQLEWEVSFDPSITLRTKSRWRRA